MDDRRIIIETKCEHGFWRRHITESDPAGSTWCMGAAQTEVAAFAEVRWCDKHNASFIADIDGCGFDSAETCRIVPRLLVKVGTQFKTYTSAEGAVVTYAP